MLVMLGWLFSEVEDMEERLLVHVEALSSSSSPSFFMPSKGSLLPSTAPRR